MNLVIAYEYNTNKFDKLIVNLTAIQRCLRCPDVKGRPINLSSERSSMLWAQKINDNAKLQKMWGEKKEEKHKYK